MSINSQNRKYTANRLLVKNSEDQKSNNKFNMQNVIQKDGQPLVHMNFMSGLDSRNIENTLIQNDQKKQAKTCKQSTANSRHMSPNRSQVKEANNRARSF